MVFWTIVPITGGATEKDALEKCFDQDKTSQILQCEGAGTFIKEKAL